MLGTEFSRSVLAWKCDFRSFLNVSIFSVYCQSVLYMYVYVCESHWEWTCLLCVCQFWCLLFLSYFMCLSLLLQFWGHTCFCFLSKSCFMKRQRGCLKLLSLQGMILKQLTNPALNSLQTKCTSFQKHSDTGLDSFELQWFPTHFLLKRSLNKGPKARSRPNCQLVWTLCFCELNNQQ